MNPALEPLAVRDAISAAMIVADVAIAFGVFALAVAFAVMLRGYGIVLRRRSNRGRVATGTVDAKDAGNAVALAAGCLLLVALGCLAGALGGVGPAFGWVAVALQLAAGVTGGLAAMRLWQATKSIEANVAPAAPDAGPAGSGALGLADSAGIGATPAVRPAVPAMNGSLTAAEQRAVELSQTNRHLETALRDAAVRAFSQDRDLRYTWVCDPTAEAEAKAMVGRTDAEVLPADLRETVIAMKQNVLRTGQPQSAEVSSTNRGARSLYALHIAPFFGGAGEVLGLTGSAVDLLRLRGGGAEDQAAARMRTALHHYEIALRGSHVILFTQDRDLRFTSLSNPLFGREAPEVVGRTDEEVLPAGTREQFAALAHAALATGRSQAGEVNAREAEKMRWYELHVEPLLDDTGSISGVTCALFDITERKTHESHLRLIMRELTHRSKNLLAVIQSMARQTGRHAGSIDDFLDSFGDRLQAIATSHDLLVQEGWYGASLHDLTHRQLAKYIDGDANRVTLSGPAVHLKPAAAQSFGLALHELATNAERFGALSSPQGRVEINWRRQPARNSDEGIEIVWAEHGGPDVTAPTSRGFGSLVVEKNLSRALDAEVNLTFEPSGVRCRMLIPASHLLAAR